MTVAIGAATLTACGPYAPPLAPNTPVIQVEGSAITKCQTVNWTIQVLNNGTDVTSKYTYTNISEGNVPAVAVPSFDVTAPGTSIVRLDPYDPSGIDTYRYTLTCQTQNLSTGLDVPVTTTFLKPVNVRFVDGKIVAQF
ncbi:hypothetical protein [Deinococcus radiotolerans]|uniref:Lipoprotein n=1 Tax=Deinococcus radiotolerans TaxID=1309407 RepID=A0ABQ2FNB1_9DEIO|nr:hypothetical protein [Deinococcus radiotolerans]GGL10907.1 hypothetical protein GCM10010844_31970 [Deinococcus radiotolerans]